MSVEGWRPDRRQVVLGGAALAMTPPAQSNAAGAEGYVIADSRAGRLRGRLDRGVASFKGVAYGAPTGGDNRFLPPKPPVPWTGVRDALEWGLTAPQRPIARYPVLESWDAGFDDAPKGEDCLALNVWTPSVRSGRRPVMLYLHGGGFTGRSGSRAVFDGAALARRSDVVVVTINHRLNLFGYIYLGHLDPRYADSGNAGTLDTIAALQWVRDNIAGFGGDAGNVTVFGQSGGGQKISVLLASPPAKALFHKAILQSGSYLRGRSIADASAAADAFLKAVDIAPGDLDRLQRLPWQKVSAVLQQGRGTAYADRNFEPVIDGRTLPDGPWYPGAPALSAHVPLMIGSTRTETTMLLGSSDPGVFAIDDAELRRRVTPWLDSADAAAVIADFRRRRPRATPAELYFAITTAVRFHRPAAFQAQQRLGERGGAPVYMYQIDWSTPVDGGKWGAPHSMDHGFVFRNLAGAESMYGNSPDVTRIADQMSPAWAAFARTGRPDHPALPPWPTYDARRQATMMFDVRSHVADAPWKDELASIAAVPVVAPGGDPLTRALR